MNQDYNGSQTLNVVPPYHPVDRVEEIKLFTDTLDRIQRKLESHATLLQWHGGPGIGKTMLVDLLQTECMQRGMPSVRIDFRRPDSKRAEVYSRDPAVLIEDIVKALNPDAELLEQLEQQIQDYRDTALPEDSVVAAYAAMSRQDRLFNKPEWLEMLQTITATFSTLIQNLAKGEQAATQMPVALFFDETEYAAVALTDWIEEWIITPLSQMPHCVIVWTARRPWRWKRPETRRRIKSYELDVFAEEQVKAQFAANTPEISLAEALFENVYRVTGGHPFANAVVISQIGSWDAPQTLTPEMMLERQQELLNEIFSQFICDYALADLAQDEQVACELLAMVRLFDTTMLRRVLADYGGALYEGWRQEDFGALLLRLKRTQLLVWGRGYALEPSLRYLIRNYYVTSKKSAYLSVNKVALQVYQDWLERPVDNRGLFVVEELYHQACLVQAGEAINLEVEFAARLDLYPQWIQDKRALSNALEHLAGELKHDQELSELIRDETLTKLVQLIEDKRSSLD